MSLRFNGGEVLQRGRGIGGLLRLAKGLFRPLVKTVTKAVGSKTGRAVLKGLKRQAIDSGANIIGDLVSGNNIKDSLKDEVGNIRVKAGSAVKRIKQDLLEEQPKAKKYKTSKKIKRRKKTRDIFD